MSRRLLIAGIDFGTSFTKVVVADNVPGRKAVAVRFSLFADGLLPSVIGVGSGRFWPPTKNTNGEKVVYPKMVGAYLASGSSLGELSIKTPEALRDLTTSCSAEGEMFKALLAFYFAYIMAEVEKFIPDNPAWSDFRKSAEVQDFLVYQLAVPTGLLDASGVVEQYFRDAFIMAHKLRNEESGSFAGVSTDDWLRQCRFVAPQLRTLMNDEYQWQCLVYPETAGAAQAYFRSPNAGEGLFITMDVGAGTVDMNAFRRLFDIRDCDYYATSVRPLGAQLIDDPHGAVDAAPKASLRDKIVDQIKELLLVAKRYQPNHVAGGRGTWDEASCFIFGGGAMNDLYWRAFADGLHAAGLQCAPIMQLPAAGNLDFPDQTDFGRFAVAAGLSVFRPNLDKVRLPHQLAKFHDLYPTMQNNDVPYGFHWDD